MKWAVNSLVLSLLVVAVIGQFTSEPSPLVQRAPFRLTTSDSSITSVFLSTEAGCSSVITGTQTALSSLQVEFNLPDNTASKLYLCNTLSSSLIQELDFFPISFSPGYLFLNEASDITFTDVTPVGSTVQVRDLEDCSSGSALQTTTLPASRKVTFTMNSISFAYVCVTFTVLGSAKTLNAGPLRVTDKPSFTPNAAITHESVTFTTSGAAPPNTQVIISDSDACLTVLQGPLVTNEGVVEKKSVTFQVLVQRGIYHFCIRTSAGSGPYVSGGLLTITQFGVNSTTMYAGRNTVMVGTLDTPKGGSVVLSSSQVCAEPYVQGPTVTGATDNLFVWTVAAPAELFACVLKPATTTYIFANKVSVVAPPVVTVPTSGVRGLLTSVSSSTTDPINITIGGTSCTNPVVEGTNPSDGIFRFVIPVQSTLLFSSLVVCLTTLDGSATYQMGTFPIGAFQFTHVPAIAGVPLTVQFDPAAPAATPYRFSTSAACDDGAIGSIPSAKSDTVTFASASTVHLCINAQSAFVAMRTITVRDLVQVSTAQFLAGRANQVQVNGTFNGQVVFIAPSCDQRDAAIAEATAIGAVVDLSFNVPNASSQFLCGIYSNSSGLPATVTSTAIGIFKVGFTPTVHVRNQVSRLRIQDFFAGALDGATVFLPPVASACVANHPNAVAVTASGTTALFDFTLTIVGAYRVCLTLSDSVLLDLGIIRAIDAPVPQLPTIADAGIFRGVPFSFVVNDPYIPAVFALTQNLDCTGSKYTGTFDGAGQSIAVVPTELEKLSLCISSDDAVSLLRIAAIEVVTFQATRQRFVRGFPAILGSTPALPSEYTLGVFASATCAGSPIATNPLVAAAGSYTMCASLNNTAYSIVSNSTISVIESFSVLPPTDVKTQVSGTYVVTGGDTSASGDPNALMFVVSGTLCLASTEVFPFTGTSVVATTAIAAGINVDVCVRTKDGTNAQVVATVLVKPYMSPTSIAKGIPATITSGAQTTGFAKLSSADDCADQLIAHIPIVNGVVADVVVPLTVTNTVGTYCERTVSGTFVSRGPVQLLGSFKPSPNSTLDTITVQAGVAFTLSVTPDVGSNPFLSHYQSCNDTVTREFAYYIPAESEDSQFYMCVTSPDGSTVYTNPTPSVIVEKFTLAPRAVRRYFSESLSLSPAPPSQRAEFVFLSESEDCSSLSGALSFVGGNVTTVVNYTSGKRWMCMTFAGRSVPIASFAVVEPPVVYSSTNRLFGAAFCLSMSVPESAYSVINGADASFPLSSYYATTSRTLYIAQLSCSGSSISEGAVTQLGTNFSVCFVGPPRTMSDTNSFVVCATTPAGVAQTADTYSFEVNATGVNPDAFVSGTVREVQIPSGPFSTFKISSADCSTQVTANFTTNGTGFGQLSTIGLTQDFIDAGTYSLCLLAPDSVWYSVFSVAVVRPSYFSVSNTAIVAGVQTPIILQEDLRSSMVLPGLYASADCAVQLGAFNLSVASDTQVNLQGEAGAQGFLCAAAPVNGSRIAVAQISSVLSNTVLEFNDVGVVCQQLAIVAKTADAAASIFLADPSCCTTGQGATTVREAVQVPGTTTDFRLTFTQEDLEKYSNKRVFPLCYQNASVCLQMGLITYALDDCDGTATVTPVPNGSTSFIGGAAPQEQDDDFTEVSIVIIIFAILLCIIITILIMHQVYKANKVVPEDENPTDPIAFEEESQWKRTFDELYSANRTRGNQNEILHSILEVPVELGLDNCHELPLDIQDLITEEGIDRQEFEDSEQYVFDHIIATFHAGTVELHTYSAAVERSQFLFQIHETYQREIEDVGGVEETSRFDIEAEEEEARLGLAELERSLWRNEMELQGQRLHNILEHDPYWRDRRQQLRNASQSAISVLLDNAPTATSPNPMSINSRHGSLPPLELRGGSANGGYSAAKSAGRPVSALGGEQVRESTPSTQTQPFGGSPSPGKR